MTAFGDIYHTIADTGLFLSNYPVTAHLQLPRCSSAIKSDTIDFDSCRWQRSLIAILARSESGNIVARKFNRRACFCLVATINSSLYRFNSPMSVSCRAGKHNRCSRTCPGTSLNIIAALADNRVISGLVGTIVCNDNLSDNTTLSSNGHSTVSIDTDTTTSGIILTVISTSSKGHSEVSSVKRIRILNSIL